MIELAEKIFTQGGILALVLILALVALLIVAYTLYSLVKMKRSDGETVKMQAIALAEFIKTQAEITKNQLKLGEILSQHDQRAITIGAVLDKAVASMHEKSDARDQQIKELPGKVGETMTPKLEELPRAIEEALAPKIETLQADIRRLIQSLDDRLSERIEAATDEIPNRTNKLVREELAILRAKIETSLRDIIETAKSVQIPDEDSEPQKTEDPEPGEQPAADEMREKTNGAN